jgi:hypothetical protein
VPVGEEGALVLILLLIWHLFMSLKCSTRASSFVWVSLVFDAYIGFLLYLHPPTEIVFGLHETKGVIWIVMATMSINQ